MAGPRDQTTSAIIIPLGEATVLYAPSDLAGRIENMVVTPEGTLESVLGPAPWIPDRGQGYPVLGEPHGIFSASMLGGMDDLLLLRAGSRLYRYAGWSQSWESLVSGLTDERRPRYPDQFVAAGNFVVWTNGIDRPRIIRHDGRATPLGFSAPPAAPIVDGPANPNTDDQDGYLPNALGYSWWGGIGDTSHLTDAQSGWLLDGTWNYAAQLEDEWGNLSPISARSGSVGISSMFFSPLPDDRTAAPGVDMSGANADDHTRQFLVRQAASSVPHAFALRILRTRNTRLHGDTLYLVSRHTNLGRFHLPDGKPDSRLGPAAVDVAPVTTFRVMTMHNGSLVAANFPEDPGLVRESEPGFLGTFPLDRAIRPDSGGAEVTAVASHNGMLYAFTENSVYAIADFAGSPVPLARGIGTTAPRSIQALPNGMLIWLSYDGFYGLLPGDSRPTRLSDAIHRLVRDTINRGRLRLATSAVDPQTGTYICSIAPAGQSRNLIQLCFDGHGFRRLSLGISFADLTQINDWRGYVLGCGRDATTNGVWALNREVQSYTPPARASFFRSAWLAADPTGSLPVRVRKLYVRLVDGSNDNITVRFFRDGSFVPVDQQVNFRAIGHNTAADPASPLARNPVSDIAGSAVIGTSQVHARRATWRSVTPNGLQDCHTWAFELRATYPARMHLAGFAFDISITTDGDPRGRIPRHSDD